MHFPDYLFRRGLVSLLEECGWAGLVIVILCILLLILGIRLLIQRRIDQLACFMFLSFTPMLAGMLGTLTGFIKLWNYLSSIQPSDPKAIYSAYIEVTLAFWLGTLCTTVFSLASGMFLFFTKSNENRPNP